MTPSARQLGLLLLLLLPPVPAMSAASLLPKQQGLEGPLVSLVMGPLRGHDLLLVSDDHSERLVDVGEIVEAAGSSNTPVLLVSPNSLLHTDRPDHHTKGSLLTALILFYDDPTEFFLLLNDKKQWNPGYLILFCLDPSLNTTSVINQPVVQRSEFILLLQITHNTHGVRRLTAFTSIPTSVRKPLGYYNHTKFPSRHLLFPPRFLDFGGKVLESAIVCYDQPFVYYVEGECVGANTEVLSIIGAKHNFTWYIHPYLNLGSKDNGTWEGALSELIYGGKHILFNAIRLNSDRLSDFDFTYPYWKYSFGLLLRIPTPLPRWQNILYPFSTVLWVLVILTTVVSATLLSCLVNRVHNVSDPVDIALKVTSGLLGQAMDDRRVRGFSWARVWLLFWWVAVDVLAAAYMSNLITVLTLPLSPSRMHTLQDVAESDLIPLMVDYSSFVPEGLKISPNPVYKTLGQRLALLPFLNLLHPYDECIKLVYKGTHTLIVAHNYLVFTKSRYKLTQEETYILDEKLFQDHQVWYLPLHTPYTSLISHHLHRLLETGVLQALYNKHWSTVTGKSTKIRSTGVLSLDHVQGAFIALILGLGTAGWVMLMEMVCKSPSRRQKDA